MACDSTTSIQEFLIKTKLTGAMSGSLLQNREFVFGDTEKSLFVKAAVGTDIYQFGRISDSLVTSSNVVWSSDYTKNYIDSLITAKSILLTAGGIFPDSAAGCTEPYSDTTSSVPKVLADFTVNQKGFWNIALPGDYSGNISKITVLFTGPASACTWGIKAKVLADNIDIDSGGTWSTEYTLTTTPANANRLEKVESSGTIDLFGSSSNQGNFAAIEVKLNSGSGTFKLLQVKLEY
jgi:hypothetical protein